MKVMFVGDQPSRLNKDPDVPFVGARCYPRLMDWISYLQPDEFAFRNSHTQEEIESVRSFKFMGWKIVALGLMASRRLDKNQIEHFAMEHPSGRNRKLNDKNYVDKRLKECYNWIRMNNE